MKILLLYVSLSFRNYNFSFKNIFRQEYIIHLERLARGNDLRSARRMTARSKLRAIISISFILYAKPVATFQKVSGLIFLTELVFFLRDFL